ncbi:MAG: LD-carboxypeptidase [Bacteroidota bacterium]|nr:LD-carboxypeptidase [Bacteroidota bacterium]
MKNIKKTMVFPPFLKQGDTIVLVATARKITKPDIAFSIQVFESWGLTVHLSKYLFEANNQFAGTDDERLFDLQSAIDNPNIKAIFCVKGGYGTARIIDKVNFESFNKNPKWVCGFSDVTVLLMHLANIGFAGIHSIMPTQFPKENSKNSIESLKQTLFGELATFQLKPHPLNINGKSKGKLIGGNLTIINNLIATSSDFDFENCILFIEDIDEYLYHIDRMLGHLFRTSKLNKLAGLIVGHFSDMKDNTVPFGKDSYAIISDYISNFNFPVVFGFPVGHEFDNLALIVGSEIKMDVDSQHVVIEYLYNGN